MKKVFTKVLVCAIISLCAISSISMCMPVKAATNDGIMPYSADVINFSFKGSCGISRDVTGKYMDMKVRATASNNNNETITVEVFIQNRNVTNSYTFLSDGKDHIYRNIYLGSSGGSPVYFTFRGANPEITIYQYLQYGS